ncbi:unnamed protein product [Diatraea saccharalis]|uniref:Structure-specific endonuclease subunit SLX1 C-terminal domain-containing protein n=1 Tax=Diatraea saccharalis TaxID=40085 RepID=A0A9N9R8D1_9NEOP|nr:unnamed protein product [Diatraea saccharalis]
MVSLIIFQHFGYFEWAWQNPTKTIRLQHLNLKKIPRKESEYQYKLRIMSEMLRVGPWSRLPLIIRWLEQEYFEDIPIERKPPNHMKICNGPVKTHNLKKLTNATMPMHVKCMMCSNFIIDAQVKLTCLNPSCELVAHITCLADIFLNPGEFIPIEGQCPYCDTILKWGDLIRKMNGCKMDVHDIESDNDESDKACGDSDGEGAFTCSQDRGFVDNNSHWFHSTDIDNESL